MPKKLTLVGVLMALVTGAFVVFQGTATATPPPVQDFPNTGAFAVNAGTCYYDGSGTAGHPVLSGTHIVCGPNTTETNVPNTAGAAPVESFTFIELQPGNRLTLPITFTPSAAGEFASSAATTSCGAVDPDTTDGRCTNLTITGRVTAQPDLFCSGAPYDVLAESQAGVAGAWPDDPSDGNGWVGFPFKRTEEASAGTGIPSNDTTAPAADLPFLQNAYVNQTNPFPNSFAFVSLDTAILTKLFLLGGGAGVPIPNTPLQLYTATSSYRAGLNVSVALLGGNPGNPPTNDYLCLDSPQHSETNITYTIPPTTDRLYPRWVIFTSAKDFVSGDVTRLVDLQCVGVGAVTAVAGGGDGDADDDCLTPANGDTNDANADQDGDGLADGIEAFSGSSMTAADADGDGANDYVEMFQFTNPTVADTDGDGSKDLQDNGGDDNTGTLLVDDNLNDDNCPQEANPDQLNTDSFGAYKGGVTSLNNINPGGATSYVEPGDGPYPKNLGAPTVTMTSATSGTVSFGTAHGYKNGALVDISGITGRSGGSAAENNAYAWYLNNPRVTVGGSAPGSTSFTFTVPTGLVVAGTATGTIAVRPSTGDSTQPDADTAGDACDTDDDNDALVDVAEPLVEIINWAGAGTTVCKGPGSGGVAPAVPLSVTNGDSDRDMFLDGEECRQSSRPDISSNVIASCGIGDTDGCSQPANATAGADPDADALYFVGGGVGSHQSVEAFYHTLNINQHPPTGQENDIDNDGSNGNADADADADWNFIAVGVPAADAGPNLRDGVEVRFYGTDPSAADSDNDGCDDAREIADLNGDRTVNPGDQALIANRLLASVVGNLDNGSNGDLASGDRAVNAWGINFDLNKDRVINPGDQATLSFLVAKGGACAFNRQQGQPVTNLSKGPF